MSLEFSWLRPWWLACAAPIALFIAAVPARGQSDGGTVEFNRDIRPLLSDKCYMCHGPDKNKRQADLRLDTQEGLFRAGDEGANVTAGKPDQSAMYRRILSTDPDQKMPPPDSGKELTPKERELIRRWIEQGAPWEGHWAFQPIKRPSPPTGAASGTIRNPIDAFVQQGLRASGLAPAPEADRLALIRRLSFDLRGLPPTPDEVERFVADIDPQAYEHLVDRMLESHHFGERMALWWLDLVRYADSVGYHGDQPVSVFPYREYVIDAFNANKRFDQFTVEQLAGDLLPAPTLEQQIASGYNRLGMMSAEGGVQDKEYLAKYIAERVRNVSGAWLGVTLGCCECHSHKYDPFTSRDFYGMEAFFADIQERGLYSGAHASGAWGPHVSVPTPQQAAQLAEFDRRIAELRRTLDTPSPELVAAQQDWERTQVAWTVLRPTQVAAERGTQLTIKDDGSVLASGPNPGTEVYTITIADPPAAVTALRLEVLSDDSLPKKGPGRAGNGNFVLTEFLVQVQQTGESAPKDVPLQNASATYEQTGAADKNPYGKWAIAGAIDGDAKGAGWGWAILEQAGQPQAAVFETTPDVAAGPGSRLTIVLRQNHENSGHTLGRFRLAATGQTRPIRAVPSVPAAVAAILAIPVDQRSAAQHGELAAYYRSIAPALATPRKQLAEVEKARRELDQRIPTTLVTVAVAPRTIRVLARGNWMDESGEVVSPAFPAALPQPATQDGRLTRLDLARWLVSADNPLTARTFANRVWKLLLGAGLSRKLDDLGAQGEWPSHPLLLDWLAGQFIDSGWDVKQLVKTIVLSHTYRQSSAESPQLRDRDPYNRQLARQARFRLDAELVRDNALSVSGLLVDKIGGPSVRPYQPPGYWAYLNFPQREWQNGQGEELYRRGLYTHWQRQYLHPSLMAFDAPSREECAADRSRSNTPLQSLVLLNDPTYVEAARAFGEHVLRDGGSATTQRIAWLFRKALSRAPLPAETAVLEGLFEKHRAEYRQDDRSVTELLGVGAHPVPPDVDRVELAAWISVTRVVLNLHEFNTRN